MLLGIFCYGNSFVYATDSYSDYSVGSFKGAFAVGDMGNATYSVPIAVPNGGGFEPQLAVNYNSAMSGYGLFGYGFELSGISVITREGANKFLDGEVKGVTYTSSDNYVLDGKRLILQSGKHSCDGAVYTLYGEPQTMVTFHGTYDENNPNFWFEVKKVNGTVYKYGNTDSSRLRYKNKKGKTHVASWYINRAEDRHGNVITYNYVRVGLKLYPASIVYGENKLKSRGISCKVQFNYTTIGNKQLFVIEDTQGSVDRHIASIVVSTNSNVFRRYDFTYDVSGDKCSGRKPRLVSICEQNGNGEKKKPIEICWDNLDASSISRNGMNLNTDFDTYYEKVKSKSFVSGDFNGDGICDIIQLSYVQGNEDVNVGKTFPEGMYAYPSISNVDKTTGKVSYYNDRWFRYSLGNFQNYVGLTNQMTGMSCCDIDGDGLVDLLLQSYENWGDESAYVHFHWIYGKDLKAGTGDVWNYKHGLESVMNNTFQENPDDEGDYEKLSILVDKDSPKAITIDLDGDGKDDIFYIEGTNAGGKYHGRIFANIEPNKPVTEVRISFNIPSKPRKLFKIDCNNDGLQDIFILYDGGYKVYFNNGGKDLKMLFTESNSKVGTNFHDYWRVSPGDFNGDGLSDFVYYHDDDKLSVIFNKGDGSFSEPSTISNLGTLDRMKITDDDDMFSLNVADFDGDGLSDVMMVTTEWERVVKPRKGYVYEHKYNRIQWLYSTGSGLKLSYQYTTTRKDDGYEKYIFTGDFDGDGKVELVNYGSALDGSGADFSENHFYVYNTCSNAASSGKVVSIKDGIYDCVNVEYEYLTSPSVYSMSEKKKDKDGKIIIRDNPYSPWNSGTDNYDSNFVEGTEYPIITSVIPFSVVKSVTATNGCGDTQTETYSYEDFKCHVAGRGALGFSGILKNNLSTGEKSVSRILLWDSRYWIPKKTRTEIFVDGKSSVSEVSVFNSSLRGTFYTRQRNITTEDFDGVKCSTYEDYCGANGLVEVCSKRYDGHGWKMSKESLVKYDDPDNPSCPTLVVNCQEHTDDEEYTTCVSYTYDTSGNMIEKKENLLYDYDEECPEFTDNTLTTKYTYDVYGNVLSSVQTGRSVVRITKYNEYDSSGRFVTKQYQYPAAAVSTCKYDIMGNLIESSDETDSSNILTTTYRYDGWGRLVLKTSPLGISNGYTYKWGDAGDSRKQFYVLEEEGKRNTFMLTGRGEIVWYDYTSPWVKTWYDAVGRETEQETVGLNDTPITHSTYYDDLGRKVRTESKTGILTSSEDFTYDKFNRIVTNEFSTGKTIIYTYETGDDGIKTVTTNEDGRETVKSYDLWGNLVHVVDAINGTMDYYYKSNGKPSEIHSNGSVVTMQYDEFGNQIALEDPDAGTMRYTYAADGRILKQTDGRDIETVYTYDKLGRVSSTKIGETVINNYYGTSGNSKLRLVKQTNGNNFVAYMYDKYGRVVCEDKYVDEHEHSERLTYTNSYNDFGQLSEVTYPGGLVVSYEYDKYGNKIKTVADGKAICEHVSYDGKEATSSFLGKMTSVATLDDNGFPSSYKILRGSVVHENFDMEFDPLTGNLLSRKRGLDYHHYYYDYDDLDRLVRVRSKLFGREIEIMSMDYSLDGCFLSKSNIGRYEYDKEIKPHAVLGVENKDGLLPLSTLDIVYNSFGKVQSINDEKTTYSLSFDYGPDMERCYTVLSKNGKVAKTILFGGDYEKVVENGITREFYYLDGNTIVIKRDGEFTPYLALTDHLGSYFVLVDSLGERVYNASYDVWGKQSFGVNNIGLQRGYTGHEMLNEFNLINMNGRLYDPMLGRFLSPDNYVQMPDNTQNFNRYSYCLNNPLKYNDPSGEFIPQLIGFALAGGLMNCAINKDFNWKYFLVGAVAGAVSAGVAQGVNVAMAGGSFWNGAIGLAKGIESTGFLAGAASGASAGFSSGFILGAGNSWVNGSSFADGISDGMKSGFVEALKGGIIGGIHGGLSARTKDLNFWTGTTNLSLEGAYTCYGCGISGVGDDYMKNLEIAKGMYVGTFESVKVFETKSMGSVISPLDDGFYHYKAVTLPGIGIIAPKGALTGGTLRGTSLLQHEFGHILQYLKHGGVVYWHLIAPSSIRSAAFSPKSHANYWTETYANYLSKNYFGSNWIDYRGFYPAQNISKAKLELMDMINLFCGPQ